jgi:hypothetical protein
MQDRLPLPPSWSYPVAHGHRWIFRCRHNRRGSRGGAVVMVGDAEPPFAAPTESGSTTVGLHVYLDDVDMALARAEQAGATILQPAQDMFYGDRAGMLQDPFGHIWVLLTHQEDLEPAEIKRRGGARRCWRHEARPTHADRQQGHSVVTTTQVAVSLGMGIPGQTQRRVERRCGMRWSLAGL